MRAIILMLTFMLSQASAFAARQGEGDAPRYLDAKLVPAEGRAAADFVPRGWKLEGGSESVSTNYLTGLRLVKRSKTRRRGRDPLVVSNRTARVKPARLFIEDVDYDQSFNQ